MKEPQFANSQMQGTDNSTLLSRLPKVIFSVVGIIILLFVFGGAAIGSLYFDLWNPSWSPFEESEPEDATVTYKNTFVVFEYSNRYRLEQEKIIDIHQQGEGEYDLYGTSEMEIVLKDAMAGRVRITVKSDPVALYHQRYPTQGSFSVQFFVENAITQLEKAHQQTPASPLDAVGVLTVAGQEAAHVFLGATDTSPGTRSVLIPTQQAIYEVTMSWEHSLGNEGVVQQELETLLATLHIENIPSLESIIEAMSEARRFDIQRNLENGFIGGDGPVLDQKLEMHQRIDESGEVVVSRTDFIFYDDLRLSDVEYWLGGEVFTFGVDSYFRLNKGSHRRTGQYIPATLDTVLAQVLSLPPKLLYHPSQWIAYKHPSVQQRFLPINPRMSEVFSEILSNPENFQVIQPITHTLLEQEKMYHIQLTLTADIANNLQYGMTHHRFYITRALSPSDLVTVDLFIDPKSHLVRKVTMDGDYIEEATQRRVFLHAELTIRYPDEIDFAQSEVLDHLVIYEDLLKGTGDAVARDAQRIADLDKMQEALASYFRKNDNYPDRTAAATACMDVELAMIPRERSIVEEIGLLLMEDPGLETFYFYSAPERTENLDYVVGAILETTHAALANDIDGTVFGCDCNDPAYCVRP